MIKREKLDIFMKKAIENFERFKEKNYAKDQEEPLDASEDLLIFFLLTSPKKNKKALN